MRFSLSSGLDYFTEIFTGKLVADAINLGYDNVNDVLGLISDGIFTPASIILMYVPEKVSGAVIVGGLMTVVDTGMTIVSRCNSLFQSSLNTALVDGGYNICIYVTPSGMTSDYKAWGEHHYINKYEDYSYSSMNWMKADLGVMYSGTIRCTITKFSNEVKKVEKVGSAKWEIRP